MNLESSHPNFRRITLAAVMLVLTLLSVPATAADEVEVRAEASADEIFVGESIEYQVEVRNAKNPPSPDLSDFKAQFDIVSQGDQSRNQSSTIIANGRVSQQHQLSHVFSYRLTPKVEGELALPAPKVLIDGKTITGNLLTLRVITPEKQDLVLAEIQTDHTRVYPTQPFTITLRVLVHPLPNSATLDPVTPLRRRPPHLQAPWVDSIAGLTTNDKSQWLQPLLSDDGAGFTLNEVTTNSGSFFEGPRLAVFGLAKGRETRKTSTGATVDYFVYELARTFTPEKTGRFTFGPAVVKGTFVADFDGSEYTAKRLVAIASAIEVEVREIPSPRPATYCGGIGQYSIAASASPTKLRVGDPLTLTLELARGDQSGSLDLVSAPDLSILSDFAASFELIDKNPTGQVDGKIKRFTYAMRPKSAGVRVPALSVSTFDPQTEKFSDLTTDPIPLEVVEANKVSSGDLIGSRPSTSSTEIKSRAEGIFQNLTDPTQVYDEHVNIGTWIIATGLVWAVSGISIGTLFMVRRKRSDATWMRRQHVRQSVQLALERARESNTQGRQKEALYHLRSALTGSFANVHENIPSPQTSADVASVASLTTANPDDQIQLLQLLEAIEAAEYSGIQSIDTTAAIDSAMKLIDRLKPHLLRKKTERGIA